MTDPLDLEGAEREAESEAEADAGAEADAAVDRPAVVDHDGGSVPTANDYSVAFSPRNVAVGLAIVAGVVAFAVSRRRRSQREDG